MSLHVLACHCVGFDEFELPLPKLMRRLLVPESIKKSEPIDVSGSALADCFDSLWRRHVIEKHAVEERERRRLRAEQVPAELAAAMEAGDEDALRALLVEASHLSMRLL